jgi:gamma-D-glutamyl-L-lysine dipeptidyl-peptidase
MISGICNLSLAPLRAEPSEKSEMVTQILFGELFELLDDIGNWFRIRLCSDSYVGWCSSKMLQLLPEDIFKSLYIKKPFLTKNIISTCRHGDDIIYLPAGSRIYLSDTDSSIFYMFGGYEKKDCWQIVDNFEEENSVAGLALKFLNAPYLWGGKSLFGIDCSGLVQVVFSLVNIFLPRDAGSQVKKGILVPETSDILPGDLAFFSNESGKIVHVGICLGDGSILHASGSVHIDKLDGLGIFSNKLAVYTHKLSQIRRFIPIT